MAILIDPPRWPAHGTVFSHLVSDESLAELHAFAHANDVPARAFDHDHYDIAVARQASLIAAGAQLVGEQELVHRLLASGLRVHTAQRAPRRHMAVEQLRVQWHALMPADEMLGNEVIQRWSESHRRYHDVRHLFECLRALPEDAARPTKLAAWFHDVVYEGVPVQDEERSAALAVRELSDAGLPAAEVDEIERLILLTITHAPEPDDSPGAALMDADLAILGSAPGRYDLSVRDIRLEYLHFDDEQWMAGRLAVVSDFLARPQLYHTVSGQQRWEVQARANLTRERQARLGGHGIPL